MTDDFDIEAMLEASYETKNGEIYNKTTSKNDLISNNPLKEKLKCTLNDFKKNINSLAGKERETKKSHRSRSPDINQKIKKVNRYRSRSKNQKSNRSVSKDRHTKNPATKRFSGRERHVVESSSRMKSSKRSPSKDKRHSRPISRSRHSKRSQSIEKGLRRSTHSHTKHHRSTESSWKSHKSRSRSLGRHRSRSRNKSRESFHRRSPPIELTAEEKDSRTVFVWQLSSKIRTLDLEKFFSTIGKINDIRLIIDNKTRKSKGIAYVEFKNPESVSLALGVTGTRLLGIPIQVQPSQAEKNRVAQNTMRNLELSNKGPMRLCVGSLHQNISEDMLYKIFEPFGKINLIKLMKDAKGVSQGYGFITYQNAEEARRALEHMNNFEIAGKSIKVSHVSNSSDEDNIHAIHEFDKLGGPISFGLEPFNLTSIPTPIPERIQTVPKAPLVTTQCFVLSNMFDASEQKDESFYAEIHDEIIEECNQHGGILHIYIDRHDPNGNVYVKCPSIIAASECVSMLHGKSFSGRLITASYVPLTNYHQLFTESITARTLLKPKE